MDQFATGLADQAIATTGELPRVLLLHGLFGNRIAWRGVREQLDGRARLLAPDLLGYGSAVRPTDHYRLDDVVEHLVPVMERFQPTHVLGYSMGGIVALALRARYGDALAGVGVVGLPVFGDEDEARAFLRGRGPVVSALLRNHTVAHVGCTLAKHTHATWRPIAKWWSPVDYEARMVPFLQHCAASHDGAMRELIFANKVPGLAAEQGPPVSALHGTEDKSAPFEHARQLAERHGWRFEAVEDANHQVPLRRPEAVAAWMERELLNPGQVDAAVNIRRG